MLKIETGSDGRTTTIRLIGRMRSEHLDELRRHLQQPHFILDLIDLALVDVKVIRFLIACEQVGSELRNCSPYIREWMRCEQQ